MKWNILLATCCLMLLAFNFVLVQQNRNLKARITEPPPGMEVLSGSHVPALNGIDVEGKRLAINYGSAQPKALLFVFSPTCGFCNDNWPKWWRLFSSLDRTAVRPVGVDVSSSATSFYVNDHQMAGIPVLTQVDPKAVVDYHLRLTPQTILVDGSGRVEKVWSGVLDDSNVAEIQKRANTKTEASAH